MKPEEGVDGDACVPERSCAWGAHILEDILSILQQEIKTAR
jgi:hypothetical protein